MNDAEPRLESLADCGMKTDADEVPHSAKATKHFRRFITAKKISRSTVLAVEKERTVVAKQVIRVLFNAPIMTNFNTCRINKSNSGASS